MCIAKGTLRRINTCAVFCSYMFFLHIMFIKFIHVVGDLAVPSTVFGCV